MGFNCPDALFVQSRAHVSGGLGLSLFDLAWVVDPPHLGKEVYD